MVYRLVGFGDMWTHSLDDTHGVDEMGGVGGTFVFVCVRVGLFVAVCVCVCVCVCGRGEILQILIS